MKTSNLLASLLVVSAALPLASAQAGIVSVSGAAVMGAAPASVVPNAGAESNTNVAVFNELQGFTLTQAALVDATTTGLFNTLPSLTPGSIAMGTVVSSYYLHADPVGSSGTVYTYIGSVTFDSVILGIASLNAQLLDTDFLGAQGTSYPTAQTVNGVELDGTDFFRISSDRKSLDFQFLAWAGADSLRVITAGHPNAVPEPGAAGLVFAALGTLALVRRRTVTQTDGSASAQSRLWEHAAKA